MASTTEEVLRRHVRCFFEGDLEGVVSDYSADAVLFTPNGPLKGHGPIREFFHGLINGLYGVRDAADRQQMVIAIRVRIDAGDPSHRPRALGEP
jgi:ketosteroid isomerase-like protein